MSKRKAKKKNNDDAIVKSICQVYGQGHYRGSREALYVVEDILASAQSLEHALQRVRWLYDHLSESEERAVNMAADMFEAEHPYGGKPNIQ